MTTKKIKTYAPTVYSPMYVKGKIEEITGIKKIKTAKTIMSSKVFTFFSFLFSIQSLIILKNIATEPHITNCLEVHT